MVHREDSLVSLAAVLNRAHEPVANGVLLLFGAWMRACRQPEICELKTAATRIGQNL